MAELHAICCSNFPPAGTALCVLIMEHEQEYKPCWVQLCSRASLAGCVHGKLKAQRTCAAQPGVAGGAIVLGITGVILRAAVVASAAIEDTCKHCGH